MQQGQRRLEGRVGFEARLQRVIQQQVGECEQAHRLVVRHVAVDDRTGLPARQTGRRVIDRLEHSEAAEQPGGGEPFEVAAGSLGCNHQCERRRVRSHHQVVPEAALQSQPRHAEGPVLVGAVRIHGL